MNSYLIDTNILKRVITNDDPELSPKAKKVLTSASSGEYKLVITPIVLAESVYVLTSKNLYELTREKAVLALQIVMNIKNVLVDESDVVVQALEYYQNLKLDFADCYLIAKKEVRNFTGIKTFDTDIRKSDRASNGD